MRVIVAPDSFKGSASAADVAAALAEAGTTPVAITAAISAALRFRADDDPESLALAVRLAADDAPTFVTEVMGIDEGHPLRSALVDVVTAAQADPAV